MPLAWDDVAAKPEYQGLPPEQQEAARQQYFSEVVAPKVPSAQLDAARAQFDSYSRGNQQKSQPQANGPQAAPNPSQVSGDQHPLQDIQNWARSPTKVDTSDLPQSGEGLSPIDKLGAAAKAMGRGAVGIGTDAAKSTAGGLADLIDYASGSNPPARTEDQSSDMERMNMPPGAVGALGTMFSPPIAKGASAGMDALKSIADHPAVGSALEQTAAGELPAIAGSGAQAGATATGSGAQAGAAALTKGQSKAREILTQALQTEGIKPEEIAQRLEQAQKTGLPLTALDVATQNVGGVQTQGRNLLGLADAAANMPGEGAMMAGDVAARGYLAKSRLRDSFDKFIAKGKPYEISDDALQRMSSEAGPAYEKAFSAAPVTSARIEQFLKDPDIQQGLARGTHIQRLEALAEGRPFDPKDYSITGFTDPEIAKSPWTGVASVAKPAAPIIEGTANMRLLDAGKKGLDAMIGDETNELTGKMTEMGRALTRLKSSYVKELDRLNPDYAAARSAYGSQASRLQALKDGMNFQSMQPEEIKRWMADPGNSLSDQMAFSVGVRQKLQDVMGQVGDNANAITRLWKDSIRDRLEPLFGDKGAFEQFSDLMQHEQNMARVNGILTRGSQTMPRQQYAEAMQSQAGNVGKLLRFATNPRGAAMDTGLGMLNAQLQKSAAGMTNETAADIMRHLTSSDPELWRKLSLYNAPKSRFGFAHGGGVPDPMEWARVIHKARKKGHDFKAKDRTNPAMVEKAMRVA